MNITDEIYGEIVIENELILRLINTKPFQRLKEINQYGAVNFVFEEGYQTSR
jgi:HD superfamily phosphohydrolase